MDNTFTVQIRKNDTWQALTGVTVFPFDFGQLLDERLNEAYLTILNDTTRYYRPNELLKVTVQSGEETTVQYYLTARDSAVELPVGSGKYKHKLYLIEITKELEGVVCQSLTFTNQLYKPSLKNFVPSLGDASQAPFFIENIDGGYLPPILRNSTLSIKSFREIAAAFMVSYNKQNSDDQIDNWHVDTMVGGVNGTGGIYAKLTVETNGNTVVYQADDSTSSSFLDEIRYATIGDSIVMTYTIPIYWYDFLGTKTHFSPTVTFRVYSATNNYPTKRITVKDAVDRVLDLAIPRFVTYEFGAQTTGESVQKYQLDPNQAAWLEGILAPEFNMTQCTLREQLQVIGSFIHAEPRLVLYENLTGTLIRYIHFDPYGAEDPASVQDATPYVYRAYDQSINEYCTNVDTTASNIVNALDYAQGVISMPDRVNYKTIRAESVNARVTESNGLIPTTFPIYDVRAVYCGVYDVSGSGSWAIQPTNITAFVYESTAYFANLSSFLTPAGTATASGVKSYALYYTLGQKNIEGLFFKPESTSSIISPYLEYYAIVNVLAAATGRTSEDVRDIIEDAGGYQRLSFRVEYIPIYQTRFTAGKPYYDPADIPAPYSRIYNQSENILETRYYGEHIKGVAARLGNVDQSRTYFFQSLSQIPRVGSVMETEDGAFAISATSTEIQPNAIKCTVALTKDFNRISQFVGVNSVKRVYEVSERQASSRNILLKEYCVVGQAPANPKRNHLIAKDAYAVASAFTRDGTPRINAVQAQGAEKRQSSGGAVRLTAVELPVVSSSFGNAMTFSWNYKDNYSAGETVTFASEGSVSGFWQQDLAYCNFFGRIYQYFFSLRNTVSDLGYDFALSSPKINDIEYGYEAVGDIQTRGFCTALYGLTPYGIRWTPTPYILRKDSREIPNFTYALEFVANEEDLIIGSALAGTCNLVCGTPQESDQIQADAAPRLYLIGRPRTNGEASPTDLPPFRLGKFQRKLPADGDGGYIVQSYAYMPSLVQYIDATSFQINLPADDTLNNIFVDAWVIATRPYEKSEIVTDDDGSVTTQTVRLGGDILLSGRVDSSDGRPKARTIYFNLVQDL